MFSASESKGNKHLSKLINEFKEADYKSYFKEFCTPDTALKLFKFSVAAGVFYLTVFSQSLIFIQPLHDSYHSNMYEVGAEQKRNYSKPDEMFCSLHLKSYKSCKLAQQKYELYIDYSRTSNTLMHYSKYALFFGLVASFAVFLIVPIFKPKSVISNEELTSYHVKVTQKEN
tara:strand:- start:5015 stop:5530 length:516 start_codon:yes stop_codon:yes gene_type:complete